MAHIPAISVSGPACAMSDPTTIAVVTTRSMVQPAVALSALHSPGYMPTVPPTRSLPDALLGSLHY